MAPDGFLGVSAGGKGGGGGKVCKPTLTPSSCLLLPWEERGKLERGKSGRGKSVL